MLEITRRWPRLRKRIFTALFNLYPPFLVSGIRVTRFDVEEGVVEVRMKLHWWNRNFVGTHFGGSLFSMCDPYYMIMLIERLGPAYAVWDKAAAIRFRRPGRGTVRARFEVTAADVDELRRAADRDGTSERTFSAAIIDREGKTVAEVDKVVHVRKR